VAKAGWQLARSVMHGRRTTLSLVTVALVILVQASVVLAGGAPAKTKQEGVTAGRSYKNDISLSVRHAPVTRQVKTS